MPNAAASTAPTLTRHWLTQAARRRCCLSLALPRPLVTAELSIGQPMFRATNLRIKEPSHVQFDDIENYGYKLAASIRNSPDVLWTRLLDVKIYRKDVKIYRIMQGTMSGARRRGRPRTAWMDNTKTWTGLSVEESVRISEDRDKWRKYVHGRKYDQRSDRGRLKNRIYRTDTSWFNIHCEAEKKNEFSFVCIFKYLTETGEFLHTY